MFFVHFDNDKNSEIFVKFSSHRDIVKLTAQFVARNGRQFLTNLMNREQRNYQFDFLRPQHSLFQYFTKLLEQYTKILIPPKDLMARLKVESAQGKASSNLVLEQVKYRSNWQKHQEAQRRREEEKVERERGKFILCEVNCFRGVKFTNNLQLPMHKSIGTILLWLKQSIISHTKRVIFHHQPIQTRWALVYLWKNDWSKMMAILKCKLNPMTIHYRTIIQW